LAAIVSKSGSHWLLRPPVLPAVEMAGFASSSPSAPAVEMAGFDALNSDHHWLVLTDR
jgi:hypothetical protein